MPASNKSDVFLATRVKPLVSFAGKHPCDHDAAVYRGILRNLTRRCLERTFQNLHPGPFIALRLALFLRDGVDALSGLTDIESIPQRTRNSANSG
jgi:hypothetical protein